MYVLSSGTIRCDSFLMREIFIISRIKKRAAIDISIARKRLIKRIFFKEKSSILNRLKDCLFPVNKMRIEMKKSNKISIKMFKLYFNMPIINMKNTY